MKQDERTTWRGGVGVASVRAINFEEKDGAGRTDFSDSESSRLEALKGACRRVHSKEDTSIENADERG